MSLTRKAVCVKTPWQALTLRLMGNHLHLVVEALQGNLVAGMKCLLGGGRQTWPARSE